jgi:hypothetical protein
MSVIIMTFNGYAECLWLSAFMLSVTIKSIILNFITLSVTILNVVAQLFDTVILYAIAFVTALHGFIECT